MQPLRAVTGCDQRPVGECGAGCPAGSVLQSIRESERIRGKIAYIIYFFCIYIPWKSTSQRPFERVAWAFIRNGVSRNGHFRNDGWTWRGICIYLPRW